MSRHKHKIKLSNSKTLQQLMKFPVCYRERMALFANITPAFADLLVSFPALAFALATHYGGKEDCQIARQLILEGLPMLKVADAYGIPRWLRKLPPQAMARHLPSFPSDKKFNRMIPNLVPKEIGKSVLWFEWLCHALELEGAEFAQWIARQKIYDGEDTPSIRVLKPLSLYYWHSQNRGLDRLLEDFWYQKMSLECAASECRYWLQEHIQEYISGDEEILDPWLAPQKVMKHDFIPLYNQKELTEEGRLMNHCVGSYFEDIIGNTSRIFSVRLKGRHVATVEVCPKFSNPAHVEINEFKGNSNADVPKKVRHVTDYWLGLFNNRPNPAPVISGKGSIYCQDKWLRPWLPYLQEHGLTGDFFTSFEASLSALYKI